MSDAAHPVPGGEPAGRAAEPDTTAGSGGTADAAALQARVAELEKRVAELDNLWRRALADADNLRKRHAREIEQLRDQERAEVARDWLPVLDNLDRALEHAGTDPGAIIEGVRAVRNQAVDLLSRLGYPRRDDLGARFDPARHDAVASIPSADAPPGTVVEVVHPAYGDGDHQLRPAQVVVARGG
jgi:molecular chaperone GrpE